MLNDQLKELEVYYKGNRQELLNYARRLTKNHQDAEDLVNDAYILCSKYINAGHQIKSIAGLVKTTIKNTHLNKIKRNDIAPMEVVDFQSENPKGRQTLLDPALKAAPKGITAARQLSIRERIRAREKFSEMLKQRLATEEQIPALVNLFKRSMKAIPLPKGRGEGERIWALLKKREEDKKKILLDFEVRLNFLQTRGMIQAELLNILKESAAECLGMRYTSKSFDHLTYSGQAFFDSLNLDDHQLSILERIKQSDLWILFMDAEGLSNEEIASLGNISIETVKKHLQEIRKILKPLK